MIKAQKGEQFIQHPQLAGNKTKWNLNPDLSGLVLFQLHRTESPDE